MAAEKSGKGSFTGKKTEDLSVPEISVDPDLLEAELEEIMEENSLEKKRKKVEKLKSLISSLLSSGGDKVTFRTDSFIGQIDQMRDSQTCERLDYYARRLMRSIRDVRTSDYSDINLRKWRDYPEVITDSLWHFERRGTGEGQDASYWGNFIPEIPQQLIERYTHRGEWVLDPFLGSGTTMVECARMERKCIGIDVNRDAVSLVRKKMSRINGGKSASEVIIEGDSRKITPEMLRKSSGTGNVQLAILHPPYHDIVKFSDLSEDLSNAGSVDSFLSMFKQVLAGVDSVLDPGRFMAIVIGDKYSGGELIPLSHMLSGIAVDHGYLFKSIVVKNFEQTRGKRGSEMLWRYRALAGGFYVFKHEYILIFRKKR